MHRPIITLRAPEPSDAEDFFALHSAPNVMAQTQTLPHFSRARAAAMLANKPDALQVIAAEVDGHLVGVCTLYLGEGRRRHAGDLGIMVRDDYAGQGIGDALLSGMTDLAENWLGLSRIELDVFCDNQVAIHLYKKHGFVIEGTQCAWALRDGTYADAYLMARVRVGPSHA